ncbi:hypothetical protein Tco_1568861 [Tanacetum coccineum]
MYCANVWASNLRSCPNTNEAFRRWIPFIPKSTSLFRYSDTVANRATTFYADDHYAMLLATGPLAYWLGLICSPGHHAVPYGDHPSRILFVRSIKSNVENSELRTLLEIGYDPVVEAYPS